MTFKSDLVIYEDDGEIELMLLCPNMCGVTYSADKGDFYELDENEEITCKSCLIPMLLVRKVVTYEVV
tara:strand:- start:540 stop:743 length:204 start_codon:yes stop_codon:yes gene_type:complete